MQSHFKLRRLENSHNRDERAAASELRKAVTWLKFAEGHAQPITKGKLMTAATELTAIASDLDSGKLTDAAKMEKELGKASQALAEWHYFKAKEYFGKMMKSMLQSTWKQPLVIFSMLQIQRTSSTVLTL